MKKNILTTTIALLFSVSAVSAIAETQDWEKELEKISTGTDIDNIDIDNIDLDDMEVSGILKDLDDETEYVDEVKTKTVSINVPSPKEPEVSIVKEVEKEPENIAAMAMAELGFDDISIESSVKTTDQNLSSKERVFLKFVPEGTRFTVKNTYKVLPKKRFIIFHNGERVIKSPQTKNDLEKTFCFIELKASGAARVLKAGKQFTVTKTKSTLFEHDIKKSYGDYKLRTHEVAFEVDNPSIKSLTCYSAQSYVPGESEIPKPLMIKDLIEQSGNVFSIDFPAYEEI